MADQPKNTLVSTWQISGNSRVTYDYATKIVKGMLDSIKANASALYQSVKTNMGEQPKNAIVSAWKISGYSHVSYEYSSSIMKGMIKGFTDQHQQLISTIRTVLSNMESVIKGKMGSFKVDGHNIAMNFRNGLASVDISGVTQSWKNALSFSGLDTTLYNVGYKAASALVNGMKAVHMPSLEYYISSWTGHDHDGDGKNDSYTPNFSPHWYARGGFPNMGELFWANENCKPEMVGRMGNRSVVANNMQIEQGIKSAVVDGMMQVFMATQGSQDNSIPYQFNINMVTPDGEVLARQVEKGQARREARFNPVGYAVR
jgi:hypothetical protein